MFQGNGNAVPGHIPIIKRTCVLEVNVKTVEE